MKTVGLILIILLGLLPALVSAAPTASVNVGFVALSEAKLELTSTLDGQDAVGLRRQMDTGASRDGNVTTSEVQRSDAATRDAINQYGASIGTPGAQIQLNKANPTIGAEEVRTSGAEGPATSEAPLQMLWRLNLTWQVSETPNPTLSFKPGGSKTSGYYTLNVTKATVAAPNGYRFSSESSLPTGARFLDDQRTVELREGLHPGVDAFELVLEKRSEGLPAWSALSAVLVSIGALMLVRRRLGQA